MSFVWYEALYVMRDIQAHHRSRVRKRDGRLRVGGNNDCGRTVRTLMTASLIMSVTRQ